MSILAVNDEAAARMLPPVLASEICVWLWNVLFHVEICRGSLVFNLLDFVFADSPTAANQTLLRALTGFKPLAKLLCRS